MKSKQIFCGARQINLELGLAAILCLCRDEEEAMATIYITPPLAASKALLPI